MDSCRTSSALISEIESKALIRRRWRGLLLADGLDRSELMVTVEDLSDSIVTVDGLSDAMVTVEGASEDMVTVDRRLLAKPVLSLSDSKVTVDPELAGAR